MSDKKTIILNGKAYIEFGIKANLMKGTYRKFYKSSDGAVVYSENDKPGFHRQARGFVVAPRGAIKKSMKSDR